MSDDIDLDEAKKFMEELGETTHLLLDAKHGTLSDEKQTKTFHFRGDNRAEALGHSYHIRDALRENGYSAECEYLEPAKNQPDWETKLFHKIELRINHDD
jgi:hypothetical protein